MDGRREEAGQQDNTEIHTINHQDNTEIQTIRQAGSNSPVTDNPLIHNKTLHYLGRPLGALPEQATGAGPDNHKTEDIN